MITPCIALPHFMAHCSFVHLHSSPEYTSNLSNFPSPQPFPLLISLLIHSIPDHLIADEITKDCKGSPHLLSSPFPCLLYYPLPLHILLLTLPSQSFGSVVGLSPCPSKLNISKHLLFQLDELFSKFENVF